MKKTIFFVIFAFGCSVVGKEKDNKTCEKDVASRCLNSFEEANLNQCIEFANKVCKK